MGNNKLTRYETQIQIAPASMKKLNKQFALVDILLCYHGNNRNGTNMSKEVITNALPSLYGVPIVGEWITKDDGSQDFGSHGGRIILDDQGFRYEQTTVPFGFITKDAVENSTWVNITEKDGHTVHEYLELKGCVVWKDRYEEVNTLLDKNYGQSMEVEIEKYHYNSDNICVFEKITFSAACILGTHFDGTDVIPCFESACIGRHYELDSFKKEFSLMLDEYKKFNNEPNKEEDKFMDLSKLKDFLSTFTVGEGDHVFEKYTHVGSVRENAFTVIDNEDFKIYEVEFALDDEENIVADWDGKVEKKFSVVDADEESAFTLYESVDLSSKIEKQSEVKAFEITEAFKTEISKLSSDKETLECQLGEANEKIAGFEKERADADKAAHKLKVDGIVSEFAKKLSRSPKFLVYKAKLDAEKVTVDDVTRDLTLMVGQELVDGKANFSYQPQETKVNSKENEIKSRYGNLLDKYVK